MEIGRKFGGWLSDKVLKLLIWDQEIPSTPFCDFERICFEIRPGDVLLVEGRSRISDVIKTITLSRWTHAALYVGHLNNIENEQTRDRLRSFYPGDADDHLLIEAVAGEGTIVSPITKYQYHNLRICRPKDLAPHDVQKVIEYAVNCVGMKYHTRQLLDLARFMFPYGVLPRRWRSSLFEKSVGDTTRTICSTMLAEAFASVHFPVLPFVQNVEDGKFRWFKRNSSLFIPSDFDYSPYFNIIKYPFLGDDLAIYRRLPWDKTGVIYSHEKEIEPSFSSTETVKEEKGDEKEKVTGTPATEKGDSPEETVPETKEN